MYNFVVFNFYTYNLTVLRFVAIGTVINAIDDNTQLMFNILLLFYNYAITTELK